MAKKLPMGIRRMTDALGDAQTELNRLYAFQDSRNNALAGWDSEESKKEFLDSHRTAQKIVVRTTAAEKARPPIDDIEHLLRDVVDEAPRWSRKAIMRRSRFAPKAKPITEYGSNKEIQQLHATMLEVQELLARDYWRKTLSQASAGEVLEIAREASTEDSLALLHMAEAEFSKKPVDDRPAELQIELASLVDAVELPELAEADQVFERAAKIGREAALLHDDLVYGDTRAPKALRDEKITSQFLQKQQNP